MSHTPDPMLSVVIPAHNSEDVLERTVSRWLERLAGRADEVIVVENGSTDATAQVAASLADPDGAPRVRVLTSQKGMGNALRAGILASAGERVLLSADDLPFGFDDLDRDAELAERPDVLIGSKGAPGSTVDRGLVRALSTAGFRVLRRVLIGARTRDTQGTVLADGAWLRAMVPALDEQGFLFSTQICLAAELQGLRIVEVPVALAPDHAPKASTVRLSDVWAMGRGLLRLRAGRDKLRRMPGATP